MPFKGSLLLFLLFYIFTFFARFSHFLCFRCQREQDRTADGHLNLRTKIHWSQIPAVPKIEEVLVSVTATDYRKFTSLDSFVCQLKDKDNELESLYDVSISCKSGKIYKVLFHLSTIKSTT